MPGPSPPMAPRSPLSALRPGPLGGHLRLRRAKAMEPRFAPRMDGAPGDDNLEVCSAMGRTMPDWADRKLMLERWEASHRAV